MTDECRCQMDTEIAGDEHSLLWQVRSECRIHFPMLSSVAQELVLELERRDAA